MIEQGGKLRRLLVALLLIGVGNVAAQETSTVFNDDGTVTFYYRNDGAKEVMVESWFKAGGADAIADKLRADGKCGQVLMTTDGDFVKQMTENHAVKILILRADDYATWPERRAALIKSLSE